MRIRRRVGAALVGLAVLFALPVIPALAADSPAPTTNPDLAASCGLDISLVLDRSGSIGTNNTKVQQAAQTFVDALVGTGSRVQAVSFSSTATSEPGGGSSLASLSFTDPASLVIPTFPSSGTTNWDDALEVVRRSPAGPAPLVVMITDGDPTVRNDASPDGHGGALNGNGSFPSQADLDHAVIEANLIKAAGSHVFVVGVGAAVSNATSEGRIQDLSGDDELVFTGDTANIGFGQADYTLVSEFSALKTMVTRFVRELCAPSLNLVKVLQRADGTTSAATANDPDFTFGAQLSPTPSAWISPAQPPAAGAVLDTTDGVANFDWEPATPLAPTTVTLGELAEPGWVYNGMRCWRSDLDGSAPEQVINDVGTNAVGAAKPSAPVVLPPIGAYQAMNCQVFNRQIRTAVVSVDKVTQPSGLPDTFSFSLVQGGDTAASIGGMADATPAKAFAAVAPGTYDVVEAPSAHFSASSTCDDLLTQPVEQVPATGLVLTEAARWQCTFVNTLHDGTVRIVKDLREAPGGTFDFTSTIPGHTAFSLQPTKTVDDSVTFSVAPGTYSVTELVPDQYGMTASCTGQSTPAQLVVLPDVMTTCTFVNTAEAPSITVAKDASVEAVSEPGGPVAFTVQVTNTSIEPVTITEITDTVDGDELDVFELSDAASTCGPLAGQVLPPGGSATCTFTLTVAGNAGDSVSDTVEVTVIDGDDHAVTDADDATVRVLDVAPTLAVTKSTATSTVDEPGGSVVYDVSVTNTSTESVTLTSLTDSIDGGPALPLQSLNGPITQTICALAPIAAGATYTCNFTATVGGDAGDMVVDVVTATAVDDDGTSVSGSDDATVGIGNVLPSITVTKTAGTASVVEPGGPVTFTVDIVNGTAEAVTIDAITDAVSGGDPVPVDGTCAALVGTTLAGHGHTSCTFTVPVVADATDGAVVDVVTVTVSDDDEHSANASDDASVAITDAPPTVTVEKSAGVATVAEPGAAVTFTLDVTNTSAESVTVDAILDAVDGGTPFDVTELDGTCADLVGTTMEPGATASCTFVLLVEGAAGADVDDVVSVVVGDDDGTQATGTDGATVGVTDVLPAITVAKVASDTELPAPGGDVTFSITVTNESVEPVTVGALADVVGDGDPIDVTGDDVTSTTCELPQEIAVAGHYTCEFTVPIAGLLGDTITDEVTAEVTDDDGNDASGTGTATVAITAGPAIVLDETITPVVLGVSGSLPATGGAIRPWVSAAALSLVAGLWLLHGEMGLMAHVRRTHQAVRSTGERA